MGSLPNWIKHNLKLVQDQPKGYFEIRDKDQLEKTLRFIVDRVTDQIP